MGITSCGNMLSDYIKCYSKSWLGFNRIMILEILFITVTSIILFIVCHSLYDHYKEKEWRRNNPDEHAWTEQPVKKDPGL